MVEINIEKLKQWLKMKSNDIVESNCDEDGEWAWGQKFAFDWVVDILEDKNFYDDMLLDLERNKENENI